MTDINTLKNSELFTKLLKAAKEELPNAQLFAGYVDEDFASLYVLGATDEDCERVGQRVYPHYNQDDARELLLPVCVDWTMTAVEKSLLEVTNMEV